MPVVPHHVLTVPCQSLIMTRKPPRPRRAGAAAAAGPGDSDSESSDMISALNLGDCHSGCGVYT